MKYSEDLQKDVVGKYVSGISITKLSKETGIPQSTLYGWIKPYSRIQSTAEKTPTMQEYNRLKSHVKKLENMLAILQSVACTASAPLKDRLETIEALKGQYSVTTLCDALKVAKGTYYNHIFRNKREQSQNALRRDNLRPVIKEIFDNSNQLFGADKITAIMNEQGHKVCNKTVLELMREMGLYSISTNAKKEYLKWKRGENRNVVHQVFKTSAPNKAWVSDITVFKHDEKYYYICVIIDLFSRRVIAHRVSGSGSTQLVTRTFRQAYERRKPGNDLVFHSDRGAPYLSYTFQKKLRDLGITQSLSRSGQPHDNAVSESFFSYLKKEELYRHTYRSESDLLKCIDSYMTFYNEKRPHSYLQYKTPIKYEELHYKKGTS